MVARNKILKGNYKNHPEINQSFTNIVNSYQKFNGDTILSSNSFPTYGNNDLIETNDKVIIFSSSNVSGDTFTFSTTDKGDQIIFASANDGTNPDIITLSFGDVTLTGTQTLTNKTLTSPKIGTSILDTNGNELMLLTATGSAVNEITLANAASGNAPSITASGETNGSLNLVPKGSGQVQINGNTASTVGKAIAMALVFG